MLNLDSILTLSQAERIEVEEAVAPISTVSESLLAIVEKLQDSSSFDRFAEIVPWIGDLADVASEVLPPIKAVAKALEKATAINDPLDLGIIACTASYQQACAEAISLIGKPSASIAYKTEDTKKALKANLKTALVP